MFNCKEKCAYDFPAAQNPPRNVSERKTNRAMPSDTIETGLREYSIGSKLRRLRLRKSMGLVQLAAHTGLSPALLSKLEREVMHPTLPTLLRIAMVFGVGLEYFFNSEPKPVLGLVRARDRIRFPERPGETGVSYFFEHLDFPVAGRRLEAFYAEFQPVEPGAVPPHTHPSIEFLYVIRGKLMLAIADDAIALAAGDAIYFDASVPHGYRAAGKSATQALVVTAPA